MADTSYARRLRDRGNDYRRDTPRDRRFQRPFGYWDAEEAAQVCRPFVMTAREVDEIAASTGRWLGDARIDTSSVSLNEVRRPRTQGRVVLR